MANISTLTVSLVAETAQFAVSLKKSNQEAKRFGTDVKKALLPIATAATVATTALIAMAKHSISVADQIGKTAKAVGLSAETLQELRYAAQLSGVEVRGLDDSMRRFNRRLGEFATSGGGPAAKAIKDLGINVRETDDRVRNSELVFNDVIDAMAGMESHAQRAAIAAQLFGDDFGPKLVTLLDQGTEGIAALRKEARDLGIVMSNETVAGAERAQDTFTRLDSIVRGRMIKSFADNADAIEAATEAMIDFTIKTFEAFNALRQFLGFETETEKVKGRIRELVDGIREAKKAAAETPAVKTARTQSAFDALDGIPQPVRAIADNAVAAEQNIAGMVSELDGLYDKLKQIEQARLAFEKLGAASIEPGREVSGVGGVTAAAKGPDTNALQKQADALRQSLMSPLEELFAFRKELATLVDLTDLTEEEAGEILGRMADDIEESAKRAAAAAVEGVEEVSKASTNMSIFIDQAARNMHDSLAEFFFDPFENGLQGMLESFGNVIRKMVANLLASDLLNLLGSLGGPFGGFFSLAGGSLGPKAALGGFRRGRPFIAGDAGPEVISPGAGATVTPMAGGSFSFETNINGGGMDPATLIPILESNNRKLKAEFVDELRRGSFA